MSTSGAAFAWLVLLAAAISPAGCKKQSGESSRAPAGSGGASGAPARRQALPPPPRVKIVVGPAVRAAGGTLGPAGGVVEVKDGASAIHGLRIEAPPGAYRAPVRLSVSCAPVTAGDIPHGGRAVSPLITVHGAEAYADQPLVVKVPVRLQDGEFAMGFFYDAKAERVEAMPLLSCEPNQVVVATRHFSDVVVLGMPASALTGDIDSHYRPGTDDWQFHNPATCAFPNGTCEGMSLSSIWYFVEKSGHEANRLHGLYDGDLRPPFTPDFESDDAFAIRLVSAVQHGQPDLLSMLQFLQSATLPVPVCPSVAMAILLTGKPQLVGMLGLAPGSVLPVAHAVVAYRVADNKVWIANPTCPGDANQHLALAGVAPYQDGQTSYFWFVNMGLTAWWQWSSVGAVFDRAEAGGAGGDLFPKYRITVVDEDRATSEPLGRDLHVEGGKVSFQVGRDPPATLAVYRYASGWESCGSTGTSIPLASGVNLFGVLVYSSPAGVPGSLWAGFERCTITRWPQPSAGEGPLRIVQLARESQQGPMAVIAHVRNVSQKDAPLYVLSQEGTQMGSLLGALRSDDPSWRVPVAGLGAMVRDPNAAWGRAGLGGTSGVGWMPLEEKPGERVPLRVATLKPGETRAFRIGVSTDLKGKQFRAYIVSPAGRIASAMLLEPGASAGRPDTVSPTFGRLEVETRPPARPESWKAYVGTWRRSGGVDAAPDTITIRADGDGYAIVSTRSSPSMRLDSPAEYSKGALVWTPEMLQGKLAFWQDGDSLKLVWDYVGGVVVEADYHRQK